MCAASLRRLQPRAAIVAGLLLAAGVGSPSAGAQGLPDQPFAWFDNRVMVSGDVSTSVARFDDGWFNDIDYGANALRLATFGVGVEARLHERVSVLSETRMENWHTPRVLALFVRVRPWRDRRVDIQVGRIPPVFGTFGRRRYGTDNPLIGYPLAYQYLTTLRTDTAPATADALLAVRGGGWFVRYPQHVGSAQRAAGLPLSSAYVWDTGVQVRVGGPVEIAVAITAGSLAAPRVRDDNGGKQFSARVSGRPRSWLTAGASVSTGAYVDDSLRAEVDDGDRQYAQRAAGIDLELSRGHWLVRGEVMGTRFASPTLRTNGRPRALVALASSLEARYKWHPRFYSATRVEHLGFSSILGSAEGAQPTPWDAPVTRVEAGGGVYLAHNMVGKLMYQHNWRVATDTESQGRVAAQLSYWF